MIWNVKILGTGKQTLGLGLRLAFLEFFTENNQNQHLTVREFSRNNYFRHGLRSAS